MEFSLENESPENRIRQWMEQGKAYVNAINSHDNRISQFSDEAGPSSFVKKGPIKQAESMKLNNSSCVPRRNECSKSRQFECLEYESDSSHKICTGVALRKPYELVEELAIINYIMERNLFLNLKGNTIWKEMEDHKICDRTWQSLRSHFLKCIFPNINKYSLSNSAVIKFIRSMETHYYAQSDVGLPHQLGKRKIISYYTLEEDSSILKYILVKKRYKKTRGNKVWLEMCSDRIVPNRSWQSLKSRFLTILPHLSRYKLKEEEIFNLNYPINVSPSSKSYPRKDLQVYSQRTHAEKRLICNNSVNDKTLSSIPESVSPKCKVDPKVKRQIHMRALMTGKALAAKLKFGTSSFDTNVAPHVGNV